MCILQRHRALASTLSFISVDDDGAVKYWVPGRTEAWDVDCAAGRKAAVELITYIKESQDQRIMALVTSAIAAEEKLAEGVEVGFFTALSQFAVRGLFG